MLPVHQASRLTHEHERHGPLLLAIGTQQPRSSAFIEADSAAAAAAAAAAAGTSDRGEEEESIVRVHHLDLETMTTDGIDTHAQLSAVSSHYSHPCSVLPATSATATSASTHAEPISFTPPSKDEAAPITLMPPSLPSSLTPSPSSSSSSSSSSTSSSSSSGLPTPPSIPANLSSVLSAQDVTTDAHLLSVDQLCARLQTGLPSGLTPEQVHERQAKHGPNVLTPPKQAGPILQFMKKLIAGFGLILWVAAVLCFLAWRPFGSLNGASPDPTNLGLAVVILLVIFIQAAFDYYQERKSSRLLASFASLLPPEATVVRAQGGGPQRISVSASQLTIGDIVHVSMGDRIPADLRLIDVHGLRTDRSMLTGESIAISATLLPTSRNYMETRNLVFFGTHCVEGEAVGIVYAIGDETVMGRIAAKTARGESAPSTLSAEINRFISIIVIAAMTTAFIVVVGWAAWLRVSYPNFMPVSSLLTNVIGLVVGYIPDGLPVAVTLTLTFVAKKMHHNHVLVKDLTTIETFNAVSLICTDKTGTLTRNCMSVSQLRWGLHPHCCFNVLQQSPPPLGSSSTSSSSSLSSSSSSSTWSPAYEALIRSMYLCNNATRADGNASNATKSSNSPNEPNSSSDAINAATTEVVVESVQDANTGEQVSVEMVKQSKQGASGSGSSSGSREKDVPIRGDASDTALYRFACDYPGLDIELERLHAHRVVMIPFNSKNKWMLCIYSNLHLPLQSTSTADKHHANQNEDDTAAHVLLFKGAPEVVLNRCSMMLNERGQIVPLDDEARVGWEAQQDRMARAGERVLACSMLQLNATAYPRGFVFNSQSVLEGDVPNWPVTGYVFLGLVSLLDPHRPEVPGAVSICKSAHVRVAMVTGDHPTTAVAIARNVGIITFDAVDELEVRGEHEDMVACISNGQEVGVHLINADNANDTRRKKKRPLHHHRHRNRTNADNAQRDEPVFTSIDNTFLSSFSPPTSSSSLSSSSLSYLQSGPHASRLARACVISGSQLSVLDETVWSWILRHDELVFARTTPEQKLRIVLEAQARGEIVAVTGDGVNDAPALRKAHLGIAMQGGSEVAREAGSMILLDNNFMSIVEALKLGRLVYDNLKKVTLYLLPAGSWSEMLPVMANVFLGIPLPLSAFLMIIICVLTDVGPSLALVSEQAEDDIMKRRPRQPQHEHMVNRTMLAYAYLQIGMLESGAAFFNFFYYMSANGIPPSSLFLCFDRWTDGFTVDKNRTFSGDELNELQFTGQCVYFVTLVICQFANVLAVRTRRASSLFGYHNPCWGTASNRRLFVAMLVSACVAVVVTTLPSFNSLFNTRTVPLQYVTPALGFAALILVYDEMRKWIVRNFPHSFVARVAW